MYELKGAGEYVEDATSVLLLERQRQQRDAGGHFTFVDPDKLTLYFAKHRIAGRTLEPVNLARNYETGLALISFLTKTE